MNAVTGFPRHDGAGRARTLVRSVILATCVAAGMAGGTVYAPAAVAEPPSHRAGQPLPGSAKDLAASLQETTAGGEQIFCAADLPPPHRVRARPDALRPVPQQASARVLEEPPVLVAAHR